MRLELAAKLETSGKPACVVSDNGTEFTSKAILKWANVPHVLDYDDLLLYLAQMASEPGIADGIPPAFDFSNARKSEVTFFCSELKSDLSACRISHASSHHSCSWPQLGRLGPAAP